jgi:SAM-dependent methyltransferase
MIPLILGSGRRQDVDRYVELAFGSPQNIKCLGEGLGELFEAELFSKRPGGTFRIIDIGCGGGWITLSALDYCLSKAQSAIQIELLALDPDEQGMVEALRAELKVRGATQDEADPTKWRWAAGKGSVLVEISIQPFESLMDNSQTEPFDAVLSFFTLQRLDYWREALKGHIQLVKREGGILILSELHGDYAGWSNRFDKILASDELAQDQRRQNYIRFIRCYHDEHRVGGNHIVYGPISASDLGPAFELLGAHQLVRRPDKLVKIKKRVNPDSWLRGLGLIENLQPLFTFPVRNLEGDEKARIAGEMRKLAASCGGELEALDAVKFSVLRYNDPNSNDPDSIPAFIPEPAIGNNLRRIFSAVPACNVRDVEDLCKIVWEPDLLALVSHGILDDIPLTFVLHHSLSRGTWDEETPFHCRDEALFTKAAVYYYLAIEHSHDLKIDGRTTQFLYEKLPKKCVIQTVFRDEDGSKVEFEFEPDGRTLALLKITVPKNVLPERAYTLFKEATSAGQDEMQELFRGSGAAIETRLGGGSLFANLQFSKDIKSSIAWQKAEPLLDLAKAERFYNNEVLEDLRGKIGRAFGCLGKLLNEPAWEYIEQENWRDWFPRALAIQSLLGMEELVHLPSRDAREEQEFQVTDGESEVVKQRHLIEISTGGLILYLDNKGKASFTPRIKGLLLDLANLRNTSLYVAAHREEATHRVLEQVGKAAAAAIMARNVSHNLGSHPMARLAAVGGIAKYRKGLALEEDAYREIERFMSYIRARMDFIAGISTLAPGWAVRLPVKELVDEFRSEKYLLSSLTELGRTCSVDMKVDTITRLSAMVPHARMGKQALYSILENVIRNSEKHGKPGDPNAGRVEVMAIDCPDLDVVNFEIVDRGSPLRKINGTFVTTKVKSDTSFVSLEDIKGHLGEPFYLMEGGYSRVEINPKYWGLKEMKISAAFLRLRPAFKVDGYDDADGTEGYEGTEKAPWIEPFAWTDRTTGDSFLGWRIRLLRARPGLIHVKLIESREQDIRIDRSSWLQLGYSIATNEMLRPELNDSLARKPYPDRFLVVPIEDAIELDVRGTEKRSLNYLPTRRIAVGTRKDGLSNEWASITEDDWNNWTADPEKLEQLEQRLFRAWTDELARKAGGTDTTSFPLLLAIDRGGDTGLGIDTLPRGIGGAGISESGVLFAHEEAISNALTSQDRGGDTKQIALNAFGQKRMIAYGRYHGTVPGEELSMMDCDDCLKYGVATCDVHSTFWSDHAQFYNVVRNLSPQFELAKAASHDESAALSLIEAGLVWIIVIDERIAERIYPRNPPGSVRQADRRRLFAGAGVFVPDLEPGAGDGAKLKHDVSIDKLVGKLTKMTAGMVGRPGRIIVTIHLGLLSNERNQKDYLRKLQDALQEDYNVPVEIILHSGRGKTAEMKGDLAGYKFLEFSNLDDLMTVRDDKASLLELMLSLRE